MIPPSRACGLKSGSQRDACPAVLRRPLRARAEQPTAICRPMDEEDAVPNDGAWTRPREAGTPALVTRGTDPEDSMPSEMSQSGDRYCVTDLHGASSTVTCRRRKDSEGRRGCWRGRACAGVGNRSFRSAGAQRSQSAATQPCARRSPYGIEPSGSRLGLVLRVLPQKTQTNKDKKQRDTRRRPCGSARPQSCWR